VFLIKASKNNEFTKEMYFNKIKPFKRILSILSETIKKEGR